MTPQEEVKHPYGLAFAARQKRKAEKAVEIAFRLKSTVTNIALPNTMFFITYCKSSAHI
ncbi:hypothetical protein [Priestia abyssalis]|uniref:hypothetical protein n=1 Tax=Priestia abyssalis TaxID=1221450 RepID=UPI0014729E64|nr:hypothetical protein [Priestia abyssalis]